MDWALFQALGPEFLLSFAAIVFVFIGTISAVQTKHHFIFSISLTVVAGVMTWMRMSGRAIILSGLYIDSRFTDFFKLLILFVGFSILLLASSVRFGSSRDSMEFHSFLLIMLISTLITAGAVNVFVVYISIELMALASVLWGKQKEKQRGDRGTRENLIVQLGGSIITLAGLMMIYIVIGSGSYSRIADALASGTHESFRFLLPGIMFFCTGLLFKLGVPPFHKNLFRMVSPNNIIKNTFVFSLFSLTSVVFMTRFICDVIWSFKYVWAPFLMLITAIALVIGFFSAVAAENTSKKLFYLLMGQTGFYWIGLVTANRLIPLEGSPGGLAGAYFHHAVMLIAFIGVIAAALFLEFRRGQNQSEKNGVRGVSAVFLICLLSISGAPLTAGFIAKFYLVEYALQTGFFWLSSLAFIGLILSFIVSFQVFNLEEREDLNLKFNSGMAKSNVYLLLVLTGILTVLLGIFPAYLTETVRTISKSIWL